MDIKFSALSIDNNAIWIVIEQLLPYFSANTDSEFYTLNEKTASEKHRILYKEVFLPYTIESRVHHAYHHSDGAYVPDSWLGEQVCLSMIHHINQKAWWYLYFYAVKHQFPSFQRATSSKSSGFLTKNYIL